MRILKLSFSNLNSLYGSFTIDFEDTSFVDGLFLITGKTGSGKSTILDAIVLALYGKTPRLGDFTRNNTEILSKGEKHCFSEVVFSSHGKRYRARFEYKLGKSPEHLLFCESDNVVLSSKKSETPVAVYRYSHLDYDRFTKSVLLAQGGFSAFLNASVSEKSDRDTDLQ